MKYLSKIITIITFLFINISFAQLINDFRVNDDVYGNEQTYAKIGADENGNFVVVWNDKRNSNPTKIDIYFQIYNNIANKIGNNIKVNGDSSAWYPNIAVNRNGKFAITWCGYFGANILMKIFSKSGIPITSEIKLNDTVGAVYSSICCAYNGFYTIVWINLNNNRIYCQRVDSNGIKIGTNIRVDDADYFKEYTKPEITTRYDKSFLITWHDNRPPCPFQSGCSDIYFQIFDASGNKIGVNKKVNDDIDSTNWQINPSITSDSSGKFIITWDDNRIEQSSTRNVFAQVFDNNGFKIGNNFLVPQTQLGWENINSAVRMNANGDFVIGWTGYHPNKPYPWLQRYKNISVLFGNNYFITNQALNADKYFWDIVFFNDNLISIWQDFRNDNQGDIYCNIRSFSNPDSTVGIINISNEIPEKFKLYQNYPNPFNPSTSIKYQIQKTVLVTMKIYDITGREIKTLVNEIKNPGNYIVTFNGSELASGVYFYRIQAGDFVQVKKMVLLK